MHSNSTYRMWGRLGPTRDAEKGFVRSTVRLQAPRQPQVESTSYGGYEYSTESVRSPRTLFSSLLLFVWFYFCFLMSSVPSNGHCSISRAMRTVPKFLQDCSSLDHCIEDRVEILGHDWVTWGAKD